MRQIKIAGVFIPWTHQVKYLVVTFDRFLTFNNYIKNTLMKAHRTKFSLYPILNRNSPVPLKTKIQIYLLYIRLLLTYAAEAWGPYIYISHSNWKYLESIQTSTIRNRAGLCSYVSNQTVCDSAKLNTIQNVAKTNSNIPFSVTLSPNMYISITWVIYQLFPQKP